MVRINSLLLLLALATAGCTMLHKEVGRPIPESACFEATATHYHEVLDELGPPTRLTALPGGFAFFYEALSIRERQIGIGGRRDWLQLIKLALADSDLRRNSVLLHFDSDGFLVAQARIDTLEKLGMGGSIQPILSIQQVVDTAEYEDDAFAPMDWGATLLKPLPQTLNTRQSLVSGAAGLEQGGTGSKVGQHSLEMR